ncbi:MAG: ATP-binding protein [Elusimicrobiales bacterium]|nr:ATP-binding protein [Elusimicrobiales bacterium]
MSLESKGNSPFYPGHPVPVESFIGRRDSIDFITRTINEVAEGGRIKAVFLSGEYGIGKSSLAHYMKCSAEKESKLLGIHVFLGSAATIDDMAEKTLETVLREQVYKQTAGENVRNWLAKYIGKQELFGAALNLAAIRADAPLISKGFLPFLNELYLRVKPDGFKGIMLILDEINGIAKNQEFAYFIKTLIDENSVSHEPLPLLFMLCGTEERRRDINKNHPPVERIFDIVDMEPLSRSDMETFFTRSFQTVNVQIQPDALETLCFYSGGQPRIMQLIGEKVFWRNNDQGIDRTDAVNGVFDAAEEIGKKFIEAQVLDALKSQDYHSILSKISQGWAMQFRTRDITQKLLETEKKKFNNFLQRMKELQVLSGEGGGTYTFTSRLKMVYFNLWALQQQKKRG